MRLYHESVARLVVTLRLLKMSANVLVNSLYGRAGARGRRWRAPREVEGEAS